jgi:hypothetical protein
MALSAIDRVRLGLPAATGPTTTARVQRPRRRAMPRARSSSRIAAYVPPENRVKRKNPLDKLLDDGDKKGWRQIPGGISRAFEGVILGAPKLATMVGKQALAPVRAGIDVAQGELDPGQALALSNPAIGGALAISGNPAASKYQPLTADMAASGKQTAHRVTNPTEYKKAWDEGTLVDVLLEDAGNISLVAGGVGGVLGKGSTAARAAGATAAADNLAKAATVARRVSKLGGQTSDLPISIPRAGLNKAKRATIKYGEAARGGKYGTGLRKAVADALPQYSTGVGRFLTEGVKKLQRSRERAETGPDRQLHRAAVLKHKLTPAEEGAATAIRTGIAWQYKKLIDDGIAPDDARTTITHRRDRRLPRDRQQGDRHQHDSSTGRRRPQQSDGRGATRRRRDPRVRRERDRGSVERVGRRGWAQVRYVEHRPGAARGHPRQPDGVPGCVATLDARVRSGT